MFIVKNLLVRNSYHSQQKTAIDLIAFEKAKFLKSYQQGRFMSN